MRARRRGLTLLEGLSGGGRDGAHPEHDRCHLESGDVELGGLVTQRDGQIVGHVVGSHRDVRGGPVHVGHLDTRLQGAGCGLQFEGEAKIMAPITQGRELAAQVSGRGRQVVWAGIVVHHAFILSDVLRVCNIA